MTLGKGNRFVAGASLLGAVFGLTACADNSTLEGVPSVNICTAHYFDRSSVTCKHSAKQLTFSNLAGARLVFSNGISDFTSADSRFVVSRVNSDGTTSKIGTADNKDSSSTGYSNYSLSLAWVLHQVGATSLHQALYRVEVDNGTSDLGTADFTYQPSGPSVHVCTKEHFDRQRFVCTRDDHSLSRAAFGSAVIVYGEGDGAAFAGTNTHYTISVVLKDGTSMPQGTYDSNNTSLANTSEEVPLSALFTSASVTPQSGTTYSVEVDNNNHLLGVATFKIQAGSSS